MNQSYNSPGNMPTTGATTLVKSLNFKKLFLVLVFLAGAISLKAQTWRSAEFDRFPFKIVQNAEETGACTNLLSDVVLPRIIDITKDPYNAVGNGTHDCTDAFRRALARGKSFIYIPNGTYLITDSVGFSPDWVVSNNGVAGYGSSGIQMWGESRSRVILKLKDNATGFNDPSNPKAFFNTGGGSPDRFNNSIWNITFEIGTGNPGAIGLRHYLSNLGGLYNVTIRTRGQGKIGLDKSYNRANGPSLTKDVRIEGFETGIKTDFSVQSEVYEHVTLKGQTKYGFYNAKQILTIRDLRVENCGGPAFVNESGFVNILDADLAGTGTAAIAAIQNGDKGKLLVRNLSTSGYSKAIEDPQKPLNQTSLGGLYLSDAGIGANGTSSSNLATLNLEVKETPVIPWDDPSEWVDPADPYFGATPNGQCGLTRPACLPCNDDTEAIQRAIDATEIEGSPYYGRTTLFLRGTYRILGSIRLRGSIRRVIGTSSTTVSGPSNGLKPDKTPIGTTWIIEDGVHPVIEFQNIGSGWPTHHVPYFENASGRTIIIKNSGFEPSVSITNGEVFVESSVLKKASFTNAQVWARQLNTETSAGTKITLDGTTYWGLGLKTEKNKSGMLAKNQSKVEQFGGFIYSTERVNATTPMIRLENSEASISMYEYLGLYAFSNPYMILIEDVKGGSTVTVNRGGTMTAPTYPASWSQCNDGTTTCNDGKIGSSYLLYSNIDAPTSDITFRPADNPSGTVAGLNYSYYRGSWHALPDFNALTPAVQGNVTNFDLSPRDRNDNFAFKYTGYVNVPRDGVYTFYTSSDDGSQLYIGNTQVVNNDKTHSNRERSGTIGLKAGKHAVTVTYFEATGQEVLSVSYAGPDLTKRVIPSSELSRSGFAGAKMGIGSELGEDQLIIYPNPVTNGSLTVGLNAADKDKKVALTISDMLGRIVYLDNFISNGKSQHLNLERLQPGVYVIRMKGSNTNFNAKVIVE